MKGETKGKVHEVSTEQLRQFYFSRATNFSTFTTQGKETKTTKVLPSPVATTAATPTSLATENVKQENAADTEKRMPAGAALNFVKTTSTPSVSSNPVARTGDSVSPEYINFLRLQQDLVKSHQVVDGQICAAIEFCTQQRNACRSEQETASATLALAEGSTNWNWKSKYSREALIKDADIQVSLNELCQEQDIPNVVELSHLHQQFLKLKSKYGDQSAYKLMMENGVRRIERLTKDFSRSQIDSTKVARLADNLLVHLDHVLQQPTINIVTGDLNSQIAILSEKQAAAKASMDQGHEDGEMHVAERECYRLIDLTEELAASQVELIGLLQKSVEENTVSGAVCQAFSVRAKDDVKVVSSGSTTLKKQCEEDLGRLYQLKQHVDSVEQASSDKWVSDRKTSDDLLGENLNQQRDAWLEIEKQLSIIRNLEKQRMTENKRRMEEKSKDEARRLEYAVFTTLSNDLAGTLDRTMSNADTNCHCTELMGELIQNGLDTIQKDLNQRGEALNATLLHAQQRHLEVFRQLLFTLGDLEYRKEKRMEEVGSNIQAAHIQQELCNDSLNPNAKKFSDAKKELLKVRDSLENELKEIRERMSFSLDQFAATNQALTAAGVSYVHPQQELEERQLATRAKMIEYRALSLGNVSSAPLRKEIEDIKKTLNASKLTIKDRSGVSS